MRADMTVYQPGNFLYNLLIKKSKYVIIVSYWLGEEKMNKIQLKSFSHDETCRPLNISVLRMRIALMMFHHMIVTKKLLIK